MGFKLPNKSIKSAISTTGYKSNSPDVDNDVNIIPGNKITMKGVDFPVKGVGSNGVTKNMKPGEDHDFGDADYVVETPIKQSNKRTKGKGRHFRKSEEGAGMTAAGVASYKKQNPGSKLKTAVTGKVKAGSKDAKRRKAFCARSKSWTGERGKAARRRWKC
jgi:Holliday junction resolvase RusA-like endonuclease